MYARKWLLLAVCLVEAEEREWTSPVRLYDTCIAVQRAAPRNAYISEDGGVNKYCLIYMVRALVLIVISRVILELELDTSIKWHFIDEIRRRRVNFSRMAI